MGLRVRNILKKGASYFSLQAKAPFCETIVDEIKNFGKIPFVANIVRAMSVICTEIWKKEFALSELAFSSKEKNAIVLNMMKTLLSPIGIELIEFTYLSGGKELQALLYKPAGSGKWPLIAFDAGLETGVHELPLLAAALALAGHVVVGTRSRLEVAREEAEDYIACTNSARHTFDFVGDKTFFAGISSGAAIMLLAGTMAYPNGIIAVAPYANLARAYYYAKAKLAGPLRPYIRRVLQNYIDHAERTGKTPETAQHEFLAASPENFVHKIRSKTLLLHGADDEIVPVRDSIKLYEIMKAYSKNVKLKIVLGEGLHSPPDEMLTDIVDFAGLVQIIAHTIAFLAD